MTENEIAKQILDAAFVVHTKLGPGLLESVYKVILGYELQKRRPNGGASEVDADSVR
jgi:GxxExxY protein